jgi:predicted homoserine dehydrogenase-like protein
MNYQDLLRTHGSGAGPTRAALIGVGQFGRTLLMQSRRTPALELAVLCDVDIDALVAACRSAALGDEEFAVAETYDSAVIHMEAGRTVLTPSAEVAIAMPTDVVVEATGNGEAGARNVLAAIGHGRHVVLVTKETDSVVGPLLAHRARQQGLVLSQVDGDQPSLLLGLVSWARALGLTIACAGKASEYDFVIDEAAGTVSAEGFDMAVSYDASLWRAGSDGVAALIARRAEAFAAIPQRTPPDFCEMCLVANGSGLRPDKPGLHAPVARPMELAEIFRPGDNGGVLGGTGRLDIFNCFRRSDEISAAGGVFVVLEVPDEETGRLFKAKGIPVSDDGGHVLAYNPTHLLGVEAPLSVLLPHRLGLATGSLVIEPVCDVGMRATQALKAGAVLTDGGYHHRIAGIEPLLLDCSPLGAASPLPFFLGMGLELARDVAQGEFITGDAVRRPEASTLWDLRAEQDRMLLDGHWGNLRTEP